MRAYFRGRAPPTFRILVVLAKCCGSRIRPPLARAVRVDQPPLHAFVLSGNWVGVACACVGARTHVHLRARMCECAHACVHAHTLARKLEHTHAHTHPVTCLCAQARTCAYRRRGSARAASPTASTLVTDNTHMRAHTPTWTRAHAHSRTRRHNQAHTAWVRVLTRACAVSACTCSSHSHARTHTQPHKHEHTHGHTKTYSRTH
jgi:hypothetical protein